MFENIGEIVLLFWRTLLALPQAWRQRQKVFEQFFEIGNASLLMVCVLSFFIGAVISLQTGPVLVEHSLTSAVGGVVGIAIAKELAPMMMAILILLIMVSLVSRKEWKLHEVALTLFALYASLTYSRMVFFAAIIFVPVFAARTQLFTPYRPEKERPRPRGEKKGRPPAKKGGRRR